jgi:hypothetical protein
MYFRQIKPTKKYIEKDEISFDSVAVTTQLKKEFGEEKLFRVEYSENYDYWVVRIYKEALI